MSQMEKERPKAKKEDYKKEEAKKEDKKIIETIREEIGEIKLDISNLTSEDRLINKLDEHSKMKLYQFESELYANISTLDTISRNFEEGRIDAATFKRQLRALMKGAFKAKRELEKLGLDVIKFIEKEGFKEEFTIAINKLKLNSLNDTVIYDIMLESPGRIASKTFEIASDFATIHDLVKLRYNATYEMTSSLLNELQISFRNYPGFGSKHWIYQEIEQWKKRLSNKKPSEIVDEKILVELENRISIWRSEFHSLINELSK